MTELAQLKQGVEYRTGWTLVEVEDGEVFDVLVFCHDLYERPVKIPVILWMRTRDDEAAFEDGIVEALIHYEVECLGRGGWDGVE